MEVQTLKFSIGLYLLLFSSTYVKSQNREKPLMEYFADMRFEQAQNNFLNHQYEKVIEYYDSLTTVENNLRIEIYKMASETCLKLATMNKKDSISLIAKSNEIYSEAKKWYGLMYLNDRWNSIKIDRNEKQFLVETVNQKPNTNGETTSFFEYILNEIKYPEEAYQNQIEGEVLIQFILHKGGNIDGINVIKGIGGGCDAEAVRVIRNAPNFRPGTLENTPPYIRMILPITFKLPKNSKKKTKKK